MKEDSIWVLLVTTDSYGGNFERELAEWLTGQVGEFCDELTPAPELSKREREWFGDNTLLVDDGEHGAIDYCRVNSENFNAVEIHFRKLPPQYILKRLGDQILSFKTAKIKKAEIFLRYVVFAKLYEL